MGYESKLYVVEKTNVIDNEKRYACVIAMFDMSKFEFLSDIMRDCPETDCYFYADDGNTRVLDDCYGRPLTEASIDEVVTILELSVFNGENYRRIFPVMAFLKNMFDQQKNGIWKNNIAVLHYGY